MSPAPGRMRVPRSAKRYGRDAPAEYGRCGADTANTDRETWREPLEVAARSVLSGCRAIAPILRPASAARGFAGAPPHLAGHGALPLEPAGCPRRRHDDLFGSCRTGGCAGTTTGMPADVAQANWKWACCSVVWCLLVQVARQRSRLRRRSSRPSGGCLRIAEDLLVRHDAAARVAGPGRGTTLSKARAKALVMAHLGRRRKGKRVPSGWTRNWIRIAPPGRSTEGLYRRPAASINAPPDGVSSRLPESPSRHEMCLRPGPPRQRGAGALSRGGGGRGRVSVYNPPGSARTQSPSAGSSTRRVRVTEGAGARATGGHGGRHPGELRRHHHRQRAGRLRRPRSAPPSSG